MEVCVQFVPNTFCGCNSFRRKRVGPGNWRTSCVGETGPGVAAAGGREGRHPWHLADCPICLMQIQPRDMVFFPCIHGPFHKECVEEVPSSNWYVRDSLSYTHSGLDRARVCV